VSAVEKALKIVSDSFTERWQLLLYFIFIRVLYVVSISQHGVCWTRHRHGLGSTTGWVCGVIHEGKWNACFEINILGGQEDLMVSSVLCDCSHLWSFDLVAGQKCVCCHCCCCRYYYLNYTNKSVAIVKMPHQLLTRIDKCVKHVGAVQRAKSTSQLLMLNLCKLYSALAR